MEDSNDSGSLRSSSTPSEISPTTIRDQLCYYMSNVKYFGTFVASQTCQKVVDPGLHVKGVGDISLPLPSAFAKSIIKAGTQAPFGRGTKTMVDTKFRKTIEFKPGDFHLRNPAWDSEVKDVVSRLGLELGFQDTQNSVRAELTSYFFTTRARCSSHIKSMLMQFYHHQSVDLSNQLRKG